MVTNARKTDAQRLGNGKKAFNIKQVEKIVEESGTDYTAGTGITISEGTISADTSVLATKSELPDMNDYQEKLTAGSGITITNNVISAGAPEWTKETTTNWSQYLTDNVTNKDLLVYIQSNDSDFPITGGYFYFPKGSSKYNCCALTSSKYIGDILFAQCTYQLQDILQNYPSVYMVVVQVFLTDGVVSKTSKNINYYRNDETKSHKMFLYYR